MVLILSSNLMQRACKRKIWTVALMTVLQYVALLISTYRLGSKICFEGGIRNKYIFNIRLSRVEPQSDHIAKHNNYVQCTVQSLTYQNKSFTFSQKMKCWKHTFFCNGKCVGSMKLNKWLIPFCVAVFCSFSSTLKDPIWLLSKL